MPQNNSRHSTATAGDWRPDEHSSTWRRATIKTLSSLSEKCVSSVFKEWKSQRLKCRPRRLYDLHDIRCRRYQIKTPWVSWNPIQWQASSRMTLNNCTSNSSISWRICAKFGITDLNMTLSNIHEFCKNRRQGRPCCFYGSQWNYIYAWTIKPNDILKIKNALVQFVSYVTQRTTPHCKHAQHS